MSLDLDLTRLHAVYASGLSPERVVEDVHARIEVVADPGIIIALVAYADLIAACRALPPFDPVLNPLWGVPFAVKDNIDVAGMQTTAGCPGFAMTPSRSARVVERLSSAGALLIGKANLDQFATGLVGVRMPYPVPRNAIDPSLVPGARVRAQPSPTHKGSSPLRSTRTPQDRAAFPLGSTISWA